MVYQTLDFIYQLYLQCDDVVIDSRSITPNCLFFAIKGDRFDGNQFAIEALNKGASHCIVSDAYIADQNSKCILVEDTLVCLQHLATYHRDTLDIPVLVIAGSNGKTTTKELVHQVLSKKYKTFSTLGNLNNHIGVPLCLLKAKNDYEFISLEIGANHPDEHTFLSKLVKPNNVIITNIGKDHLEGFGGIEGVIKSNLEVYDYVKSQQPNTTVFINYDDNNLVAYAHDLQTVAYGIDYDKVQYQALVKELFPYLKVEVSYNQKPVMDIQSHFFGVANAYNILAATTIGHFFGVSFEDIKFAIEGYIPSNNRSQTMIKGTNTILLDAYNANPSSVQSMVIDFQKYQHPNKVLILGDMFELGEDSQKEHQAVVELLKHTDISQTIFIGDCYGLHKDSSKHLFFKSTEEASKYLQTLTFESSYFLMKGSRGMKLETLVDSIK
jgi:UDP-N-acetylmuramoyl-tripeptide--D-alanyl-D-alanine ligase